MLTTMENHQALLIRMPSDMALLPSVTRQCVVFLREQGLGFCPDVALVSRELLSNAIYHGNQCRSDKQVLLEVRKLNPREIEVSVEDEGTGFDYVHLNLALPEDLWWSRHQGLALVNTLTKELIFNAMGNRVTARLEVSAL